MSVLRESFSVTECSRKLKSTTKTNSRQHTANPKYRPCYPFSRIYFSTVTAGVYCCVNFYGKVLLLFAIKRSASTRQLAASSSYRAIVGLTKRFRVIKTHTLSLDNTKYHGSGKYSLTDVNNNTSH